MLECYGRVFRASNDCVYVHNGGAVLASTAVEKLLSAGELRLASRIDFDIQLLRSPEEYENWLDNLNEKAID